MAASSAAIQSGLDAPEIAAMGGLTRRPPAEDSEQHCTATLIAADVVITAAHCVVRYGAESAYHCEPMLTVSSEFIASDGTHYPVDLPNGRAYVPGQTFEQLTNSELPEAAGPGMCAGGAVNHDYYETHPWEDIAVLGLRTVDGHLPDVAPAVLWSASSAEVAAALGTWFEWASYRGGRPTKYRIQGMDHPTMLQGLCLWGLDTLWAPSNMRFFVRELPCEVNHGTSGLLEPGDSGGPLFADLAGEVRLAGVAHAYAGKTDAETGECPNDPSVCVAGDAWRNIWASVPAQWGFVSSALDWALDDYDADGTANDADNCPLVPNATQANANVDYERAVGAEEFGDACDPSPVGEPLPGESEAATTEEWYASCTPDESTTLEDCTLRRETHDLELWTVWSSEEPDVTEPAMTGFRYCICRDADGNPIANKLRCAQADKGCIVNNLEFTKTEGTSGAETRWLRIVADGNGRSWPPQGKLVSYEPGRALEHTLQWEWESDAAEWKDAGYWDDPVTVPPGPTGPFIAGLMWGHNDSIAGSDAHLPDLPQPCQAVDAQCGFGNSYAFWNPWSIVYACPRFPEIWVPGPGELPSASSTGAGWAPEPRYFPVASRVLGLPLVGAVAGLGELPFDPARVAGERVDPGFAVACESADGLGIAGLSTHMQAGQVARVFDDAFTPELRELLLARPDLLWLSPSEPIELGGPRAGPLAVAIERLTGAPVAFVAPDGHGGLRSIPRPPGASFAALEDAVAALGPTVYSRSVGQLVQLRGSVEGAPLDRVLIAPFNRPGIERELEPASLRPMGAVAAAYNPQAGRLWLVGCRGSTDCSGAPLELFVIDAPSGRVEHVQSLLPSLARFWLASTARGEMVLVAAPAEAGSYLVALFEPDRYGVPNGARLSGIEHSVGRVVGPPRVSGDVLLVPASKPQAKAQPERPELYHADAVALSSVRGRKHGECFQGPREP